MPNVNVVVDKVFRNDPKLQEIKQYVKNVDKKVKGKCKFPHCKRSAKLHYVILDSNNKIVLDTKVCRKHEDKLDNQFAHQSLEDNL